MLFDWKNVETWPNFLGKDYWDDIQFVPEEFVSKFLDQYTDISAYHGCHPINHSSYYMNGLFSKSHPSLIKEFSNNLLEKFGVEIETHFLHEVLASLPRADEGKVFLVLDDRNLIKYAAHYMIYGSEYILAVANYLDQLGSVINNDYLKLMGSPTIFEVDLPLAIIAEYELHELIIHINNAIFTREQSHIVDFTFELQAGLDASKIIRHYYPIGMHDQHSRDKLRAFWR